MDASQALRIGTEVRNARKSKGWTNAQLAEAAGVAPNTVSAIENGKTVRAGNLRAVLDALEIEPTTAGASYADDIELVRDMVGQWLLNVPEGAERKEACNALVRFVLSQNNRA